MYYGSQYFIVIIYLEKLIYSFLFYKDKFSKNINS